MKIGDLVTYCGNGKLYIIVEACLELGKTECVIIRNIATGEFSSLPSNWVTKIKTDNFCPLHSSTNSL